MDLYLFNQINQFAGKSVCLDSLAIFFARYFEYVLIFGLMLFLVRNFRKYLPIVIKALASAVLARFIIVEIIRFLWYRPRPFIVNNISPLFYINEASFPSGHAAFYFALSAFIYFYNKKAGIMFFIGSFLICLARVFVGIHWPSDILAGAVIGVFCGWLIHKINSHRGPSSVS